jgi:hypothetical protein
MLVTRRALPLLAVPFLTRPAAALPAEYRFRIMREGSQIGTHRVSFAPGGGNEMTARTEVDIAVRLAGFTVFRLTHRFAETWAGDRLRLATSRQGPQRQGHRDGGAGRGERGAGARAGRARNASRRTRRRSPGGSPRASTGRSSTTARASPSGAVVARPLPAAACAGPPRRHGKRGDLRRRRHLARLAHQGEDGSTVTYERA